MQIRDFLKKNSNNFYYISLAIGLLSFTWLSSIDSFTVYINKFDNIRIIISLAFLLPRILSLYLIDKEYCYKCILISIPFLISFYFCKSIYMIQSLAFVLTAYKVDKNKVIKVFIYTSLITYLISLIGILCGVVSVYFVAPPRFRCYFGFKHPSYFSIHFCTILFGLWYLYLKNKKVLSIITFEISALFLYFVPNTRTSALILVIFPIIIFYSKFVCNNKNNILKSLTIISPLLLLILSLICMFVIKPAEASSFLETFTIRFTQAYSYYQIHGIHLFKSSLLWLDNMYLFLLEYFGIICTFVYILLLTLLNKKLIKIKDYHMLAIALFFLIYALMDNYGLNIRFNISLLFLSDVVDDIKYLKHTQS